jgi:hypothetical protein
MASSNELITVKQVDDDIIKVYNNASLDPFIDRAESVLLQIGDLELYAQAVDRFKTAREEGMPPKELLRLARWLRAEAVRIVEEEEEEAKKEAEADDGQ